METNAILDHHSFHSFILSAIGCPLALNPGRELILLLHTDCLYIYIYKQIYLYRIHTASVIYTYNVQKYIYIHLVACWHATHFIFILYNSDNFSRVIQSTRLKYNFITIVQNHHHHKLPPSQFFVFFLIATFATQNKKTIK